MKAMGTVPAGMDAHDNGRLCVAGHTVDYWLERAGRTPLFLYDLERIASQVSAFRAKMPERVALHYAVKANPFAPLLQAIAPMVDGFDLASRGEIERTQGFDLPRSLAGPAKTVADVEAALRAGVTVHVESRSEARRLCETAMHVGLRPKAAVRINPPFLLKGAGMKMGGLASAFGVEPDEGASIAAWLRAEDCDWRGYHVYAGSQSLSESAIVEAQAATFALIETLVDENGLIPPEVNLGGGFGIPYYAGETPLDLASIGAALAELLDGAERLSNTHFVIELGRWLVGEAGIYLTRIVDLKDSHGQRFAATDGGLHHMLAASGNFGQFLRRNVPVMNASHIEKAADTPFNVVGRLCTPLDLLGDGVPLPAATAEGDVIAVFCAGAYGLTASPQEFLLQPAATEMLAQSSG